MKLVHCSRKKTINSKNTIEKKLSDEKIENKRLFNQWLDTKDDKEKKYWFSKLSESDKRLEIIKSLIEQIEARKSTEQIVIKMFFSDDQELWLSNNNIDLKASLFEYIYWKFGVFIIIIILGLIFIGPSILIKSFNIPIEIGITILFIVYIIIERLFG